MMGFGNQFLRYVFHQVLFGSQWGGAGRWHQSDAVAYPEDVGVYGHGGFVEYHALNDVGCLPAHSRSLGELFQGIGHVALEVLDQHLCHAYQVLGFVVGIADAADVFEYHFRCGGGQGFGCWIIMK